LIEIVNYIEGNIPQIIFDDKNDLKVDDDGNFYITKIENNQIILDTDKNNDASEKIKTLYEELVGTKENRGGIINTQIINWIKELDTQKNEINNFVFHSFVWTPNLRIENEDGTTKYFKDLEKKE
jgi:hypothetical protein